MRLPELKSHGHTVEEWKTWEGRWELINGVAYDMTPAPSVEHQRVSSRLHAAIFNALEEGKRTGGGLGLRSVPGAHRPLPSRPAKRLPA